MYKKVNCIHNPASGRETKLSHIIEQATLTKRVVVIGGGPAGLEAARVSAERGHNVVLLEAAAKLGGQLLVATAASERRDLIGIVDWREAELQRLGVDVRLNTYADGSTVLAEKPDTVIVATGGIPDTDWLDGAELCDTTWDVLTGTTQGKDDVLIYDGSGKQAAASCALELARQGKSVTIATPDDALAIEMPYSDKAGYRRRISELGIRSVIEVRLVKVSRQGNGLVATFRNELTDAETQLAAAQIIVEHGTIPMDEAYQELRQQSSNDGVTDIRLMMGEDVPAQGSTGNGGFVLHRIGDAIASRDVHASIYEAYRLCSRL
jgi:thioredoxin reductase